MCKSKVLAIWGFFQVQPCHTSFFFQMARFKVPRYVKFVDEFPLTATGKVQKFKLKEIAIDELEQNN